MNNLNKYISILITILFITSCNEEFVELENPNELTTAHFWQTEEDALNGTNAIYQTLITDGQYMRKYPWIMDARADDCYNMTPTTYLMTAVTNYTISDNAEELEQPWETNYSGIWRANQVLDNINSIDMNEELRTRLIGEAKFLRGLFYFNLLNLFNNVVVYENIPQSVEDYYIPQTPSDEVWELVYDDLSEAIDKCWNKGESKAGYTNQLGRATKAAAAAFLAKAYLMNGRFADAEPILKDIISAEDGGDELYGKYDLMEDYSHNFDEAHENNMESIFEIQYDVAFGSVQGWIGEPGPDWQKQDGYVKGLAPIPVGWGDIAPSVYLYEQFQAERTVNDSLDPRMEASLFFEHPDDSTYTVWGLPQDTLSSLVYAVETNERLGVTDDYKVFVKKYSNLPAQQVTDWVSGINRRLIRYADILLLYAECLNEAGDRAGAANYIQIVRDRANLPDRTAEFAAMSQEDLWWQIGHERLLELFCEAWRYVDLLRWGFFEDDALLDTLKARDPEFDAYVDGREYLAVPPSEIERSNGEVQQSEAWAQ